DEGIAVVAEGSVTRDLKTRHIGKALDPGRVVAQKDACSFLAGGVAVPGYATGQHNAGGAALHVPFPGAARGRVKIVDVENDVRTRRGEKAEVLEVSVAAKLDLDSSVPLPAQVGSHDLYRATKECERRFPHAFEFDRQQLGHMVLARRAQNIQGIEAPFG